jgi:HSP20 family protein
MAIVRWEPVRDMVSLQDRMNMLFNQSFRGINRGGAEEDWAQGAWSPAVDIYEKDGNIVLKAELPGIEAKNVGVTVENNILTLRGERQFDQEVQRENYQRVERSNGTFTRSFTMPTVVDTEKIKAEFKDGVLRMTLPKKEEAKPKQISINVTR